MKAEGKTRFLSSMVETQEPKGQAALYEVRYEDLEEEPGDDHKNKRFLNYLTVLGSEQTPGHSFDWLTSTSPWRRGDLRKVQKR